MDSNELLLKCILAFLRGEKIDAGQGTDWQELVRKAQQQKLLPMVYEVLGSGMPESLRASCKKETFHLIAGQMQRTAQFKQVYKELGDRGITPLVVKGVVCRCVYEKPDYRASADEDLYIPLEDYAQFHKAMVELGFETKEPDYKNAHEERYTRNGLLVEGHWELFPQENSALNSLNTYTAAFWRRTSVQSVEGQGILTLEPTDHMIFLLLHAFKHFINSGVGIRQICDIAQWSKAHSMNWEYVKEVMSAAGAECFAGAIFDAGEKYFDMSAPSGWEKTDSLSLIKDALDGGIYGSADMNRKHSSSMTLDAVEAARADRRASPVMHSLFPNRAVMEVNYPWVKNSAMLLPAAWGLRILRYASNRNRSASESIKIGTERIELLREYKII